MAGVGAPWPAGHGELAGEGKEGEGEGEGEGGEGARLGAQLGCHGRSCYGGGQPAIYLFVRAAALCVWLHEVEENEKREKRKKKKEKKKRKGEKKLENFLKSENFHRRE
jgi:hypothetical protein